MPGRVVRLAVRINDDQPLAALGKAIAFRLQRRDKRLAAIRGLPRLDDVGIGITRRPAFFALPVIPALRITPLGLFDVSKNEFC